LRYGKFLAVNPDISVLIRFLHLLPRKLGKEVKAAPGSVLAFNAFPLLSGG
jgi:hypothetical protein